MFSYSFNVDLRMRVLIGGQTRTPGTFTIVVRWCDGRKAQRPAYAPSILTSLWRYRSALARDDNLTYPIPWKCGTAPWGAIAPSGRDGTRTRVW
jgi:hypothetical protein